MLSSMVRNLVYLPIQPICTVPVEPWRFLAMMTSAMLEPPELLGSGESLVL